MMKNLPTFAETPELWDDDYFQEMMQDFTINYADEHMTELLNKLRMKRNEMVHPEDRNTELSDSEIRECIDYICGLEEE